MMDKDPWTLVREAFFAVGKATACLPFKDVDPASRMTLGGRLFPGGRRFVRTVARTLHRQGHLFPDVPASHLDLRLHQGAADAFGFLEARLQRLARRAGDSRLFHQSEGIRLAIEVTDHVQSAAREAAPGDRLRHRDRQIAMLPALTIRDEYQQGLINRRSANQQRRQAPAHAPASLPAADSPASPVSSAAPATPAPAAPQPSQPSQPSGRARRYQERVREARRAVMLRLFQAWGARRMEELGQK